MKPMILTMTLISVMLTAGEPHLVKDLTPGTTTNLENEESRAFREAAGTIFFVAEHPEFGKQIWQTDGTPESTQQSFWLPTRYNSASWNTNPVGSHPDYLLLEHTFVNGEQLLSTDGTSAGTHHLVPNPRTVRSYGDRFVVYYTNQGMEHLALIDGDQATTFLTAARIRNWNSASPNIYYVYEDEQDIHWVGVSDGTPAGTRTLIQAGLGYMYVLERGTLVDTRYQSSRNVLISDGTPEGTRELFSGDANIVTIERAPDHVLFLEANQDQVWYTNGIDAAPILTIQPTDWARETGETIAGSPVFFIQSGEASRLYVTDGTEAGTRAITPDLDIDSNRGYHALNHGLMFGTDDNGLWFSDGTPAGTHQIGVISNRLEDAVTYGNLAIYSDAQELWATDGTFEGTRRLASEGGPLTDSGLVNGHPLLLRQTGGVRSLWVTDGTPDGTLQLHQGAGSSAMEQRQTDSHLFFQMEGELWASDGTPAGTRLVAATDYLPTIVGNRAYFAADQGQFQNLPYVSDGTQEQLLAQTDQMTGKSSNIDRLIAHEGKITGSFTSGNLTTFFTSNGTAGGTHLLTDSLYLGEMHPYRDGILMVDQARHALTYWDGISKTELADSIPQSGNQILVWGDEAYVASSNLLRTDGTVEGTKVLNQYLHREAQLALVGGQLVFNMSGGRLGRIDGDEVVQLSNSPIRPNGEQTFTKVGDHLFFMTGYTYTQQAWITDGTAAGTRRIADHSALEISETWVAAPVADQFYYAIKGNQLWVSDYTQVGTRRVTELTDEHGPLTITGLYGVGDVLLVTAYNVLGEQQLWRSLGQAHTTYKLRNFLEISDGAVLGNKLYLAASTPEWGEELWQSDGTGPGTHLVSEINPGPNASAPAELTVIHGQLYFSAYNETNGRELYVLCADETGILEVDTAICQNDTNLLARAPQFGASSDYAWHIEGGTILSQNGREITWEPSGNGPVTLTATATLAEGCQGTYTATVTVSESGPSALAAISGPTEVCAFATEVSYEVPAATGAETYEWTVPEGATVVAGQGTPQVMINFGEGVGDISVVAVNGCGESAPSNLTVTHTRQPALADAGPDQALCANTTLLAANGSGTWRIISGIGGQIGDDTDPSTSFTGLPGETYLLRWTIASGECTESFDHVRISFLAVPTTVDAGEDQMLCEARTYLDAQIPSLGTGSWSIVSGEGGSISFPNNPKSTFSGVRGETYILRWTVATPDCGDDDDEVVITFDQQPDADPGEQLSTSLGNTINLNATLPFGEGTWSILEGPDLDEAQLADIHDPGTAFIPTLAGVYRVNWTVTNGSCQPDQQSLYILVGETPEETPFRVTTFYDYASMVMGQVNGWLIYRDTYRLKRTDGNTTEDISDSIHPGSKSVVLNEQLFFLSLSGLWQTDGTYENTAILTDLPRHNPVSEMQILGSAFYWAAGSSNEGTRLYKSDGTEAGTVEVARISSSYNQNTESYQTMIPFNGQLYFAAETPELGMELWRSDGTEAGTIPISEIIPGSGGQIHRGKIIAFQNHLYFLAAQENGFYGLIQSDGTEAGTQVIESARFLSSPRGLAASDTDLYFTASSSLYAWNESEGIRQIETTFDDLQDTLNLGDQILISTATSIWICDGTTVTTLKDWQGNEIVSASGMTPFGERYYFSARNGNATQSLWRTDLTDAGTQPLFIEELPRLEPRALTPGDGILWYQGRWGAASYTLQGLCATPAVAIETAAALCAGVPQNTASVADAGRGATYDWAVTGATILDGQNTPEITYQVDGGGAVTIEVTVTRPGGCEGYDAVTIPAGSMSWTLWANPEAYRDERDLDANGRIDILDYAAFFDSCN